MEVGTMEGRIDLEDLGDTDSLLESSPAANEETSKTEETSMMQPEDLEHEEKKQKRAVAKKPAGRPRIMSAKKPATKKRVATNGDAKASLAIDEGTKRLVRMLRAKMELEDGNRVSFSAAVAFAVEKALE